MDEEKNTAMIPQDRQAFITSARAELESRSVSQAELARQIDMSGSVVSSFFTGRYKGDHDEVARKIKAVMAGWKAGDRLNAGLDRVRDFVETPTSARIEKTLQFAKTRSVIVVIGGGSGIGKSKTLKEYAARNPAVWYCEFSRDTKSEHDILVEIGKAVGLVNMPGHSASLRRTIVERVKRTRGLLICDEAQHLRGEGAFDEVRTIYDRSENGSPPIGIALAGHLDLFDKIARYAQVEGRIAAPLRLPNATAKDVDALCDYWELDCRRCRAFLRSHAQDRTGLRRIAKAYELALSYAAADPEGVVTLDHVREAWAAFSGSTSN